MDSSPIQLLPVRRGRRWLWRSLIAMALFGSAVVGLRFYFEPHFEFRREHAKHAHLLPMAPLEHRPPVDIPVDWKTVTHYGVRFCLPPDFVPSQVNEKLKAGNSVAYVEPVTKSGILFSKPTDGRKDLRRTYDRLEVEDNFPPDLRPWATSYDYWLSIYTANYDQFSWALSPEHVRELDWCLRLRKQRLCVEFLLSKSSSEPLRVLGENNFARWIVQREVGLVTPCCMAQVFSKSDPRNFTLNWLDRDIDRATKDVLRLCSSVRFE